MLAVTNSALMNRSSRRLLTSGAQSTPSYETGVLVGVLNDSNGGDACSSELRLPDFPANQVTFNSSFQSHLSLVGGFKNQNDSFLREPSWFVQFFFKNGKINEATHGGAMFYHPLLLVLLNAKFP